MYHHEKRCIVVPRDVGKPRVRVGLDGELDITATHRWHYRPRTISRQVDLVHHSG